MNILIIAHFAQKFRDWSGFLSTFPTASRVEMSRYRDAQIDTKFVLHEDRVMKNITITLPEEVARWARVWAARQNGSVSKLVGELLTERMNQETAYQACMNRYLNKRPKPLKPADAPLPDRASRHQR